MTSYAGISILQCSSCIGYIERHLLASGNTIGARYWTDGWQDAPMLPDQPSLVKCPHCRAAVWVGDLEERAELDPSMESDGEYLDAREYTELVADDYLQYANDHPDLSENRQLYVRMYAWWRSNDARRDAEEPAALSAEERDNMIKLAALLNLDDENDRIMQAEIMRQLGEFAAAKEILNGSFSEEMQRAVEIIGNLTEKQVAPVAEMN